MDMVRLCFSILFSFGGNGIYGAAPAFNDGDSDGLFVKVFNGIISL